MFLLKVDPLSMLVTEIRVHGHQSEAEVRRRRISLVKGGGGWHSKRAEDTHSLYLVFYP